MATAVYINADYVLTSVWPIQTF